MSPQDGTASPQDSATSAEPAPTGSEPASNEPSPPDSEVGGPTLIDTVLPCGLRLLATRDDSLPVAAVMLVLETGSEDDPANLPGLVHALAYQLLQGNREVAPGGAATTVHDAGGLASLAIGPAHIRFENLVPATMLRDAIWLEAQRLRVPNVNDALWSEALRWARRDASRSSAVPDEILAAAHGVPGLAHDGRRVSPAVAELSARAAAAQLADRFGYDRATLIVVAPGEPQATLATVQGLFADLPPIPRAVKARPVIVPPQPGDAPRPVAAPGGDGRTLVWALPDDPAARWWAELWCRQIDRQRGKGPRLRCSLESDARRPIAIVRSVGEGADTLALLQPRLEALQQLFDDPTRSTRLRRAFRDEVERRLSTPLALGRALASLPPAAADPNEVRRSLARALGAASLTEPAAIVAPTTTLSAPDGSNPSPFAPSTLFAPQRAVLWTPPASGR